MASTKQLLLLHSTVATVASLALILAPAQSAAAIGERNISSTFLRVLGGLFVCIAGIFCTVAGVANGSVKRGAISGFASAAAATAYGLFASNSITAPSLSFPWIALAYFLVATILHFGASTEHKNKKL